MVNPGRGVYSVRREHLQWLNRNPWGNASFGRRRPSASVNVNLERYSDKRFVASFSYTPLLSPITLPRNQNVIFYVTFHTTSNLKWFYLPMNSWDPETGFEETCHEEQHLGPNTCTLEWTVHDYVITTCPCNMSLRGVDFEKKTVECRV